MDEQFVGPVPDAPGSVDWEAAKPLFSDVLERGYTAEALDGLARAAFFLNEAEAGSKISWLDRLTNAEDDARVDATERAEAASEELPGEQVEAHGGDVDPLQAIEDALRTFPADEIVVLTAPMRRRPGSRPGSARKRVGASRFL